MAAEVSESLRARDPVVIAAHNPRGKRDRTERQGRLALAVQFACSGDRGVFSPTMHTIAARIASKVIERYLKGAPTLVTGSPTALATPPSTTESTR